MKPTLYLIALTSLILSFTTQQDIDSSADQIKVEAAIINWADSVFIHHESYKFDHFKAFYTDDYFIQTMRLEMYAEKIGALEKTKANGEYNGSDESYDADHKRLSETLESAKNSIGKIKRADYYQAHFWSNIQTNSGITVYYELIVKVDDNYKVIEVIENSSIGKKTPTAKIVYKKDTNLTRVLEK